MQFGQSRLTYVLGSRGPVTGVWRHGQQGNWGCWSKCESMAQMRTSNIGYTSAEVGRYPSANRSVGLMQQAVVRSLSNVQNHEKSRSFIFMHVCEAITR